MHVLKTGSWVLVADGKKALYLRNELNTQDYDLRVVWHQEQANPATHEQGRDRPGRANSAPGARGAALDDTDWHQLAEDAFAKDIAATLNRASNDNVFDEIVLIAPPGVLGELRKDLTSATAQRILAEIPKTLTNHPVSKIAQLLKSELDAM